MLGVAILLAAASAKVGLVGAIDDRPTATIAEGLGPRLAVAERAAKACGFSRTWVWDDGTPGAQLWVLAAEMQRRRVACLRRWRAGRNPDGIAWRLPLAPAH